MPTINQEPADSSTTPTIVPEPSKRCDALPSTSKSADLVPNTLPEQSTPTSTPKSSKRKRSQPSTKKKVKKKIINKRIMKTRKKDREVRVFLEPPVELPDVASDEVILFSCYFVTFLLLLP